jgi:hypothetical protein
VGKGKIRRRDVIEDLSVNDSAHRRLQGQLNVSVVEVRHLDFVNRSTRLVAVSLRVKRAARENEARELVCSHLRRSVVARLRRPSAARGNRKAEKESPKEERHRQGSNKFRKIISAAPERKTPEPLSMVGKCVL